MDVFIYSLSIYLSLSQSLALSLSVYLSIYLFLSPHPNDVAATLQKPRPRRHHATSRPAPSGRPSRHVIKPLYVFIWIRMRIFWFDFIPRSPSVIRISPECSASVFLLFFLFSFLHCMDLKRAGSEWMKSFVFAFFFIARSVFYSLYGK